LQPRIFIHSKNHNHTGDLIIWTKYIFIMIEYILKHFEKKADVGCKQPNSTDH